MQLKSIYICPRNI